MKTNNAQHWTEEKEKFQFAITLDFIDQVEAKMDAAEVKQSDLAQALGVTEGRVSQIMNNPGNVTLKTMINCARAVGLKLSIVVYDDEDPPPMFMAPSMRRFFGLAGN